MLNYLEHRRIFLKGTKIGELLRSYQEYLLNLGYQEYLAKSVNWQAKGIIPNSGTGKKLAEFLIRNLVKLVNFDPWISKTLQEYKLPTS
jgi:hypothetical protein